MHDIDLELELNLQGKHEEARAISDKLETLGPDQIPDTKGNLGNPEMWMRHSYNRGWFLIQDGEYQAGSQLLENGRYLNVYGSGFLRTDAPIYNPNQHDIRGKSIIISLEGGYGDEMIHARFATSFKKLGAAKVYLASSPDLVSVLSRIEGVDGVILRNQSSTVAHDFWIPGFSAGWLAGHTFEDFPSKPYLTARPESIDLWKQIINSDKVKVGIRWAGNPKYEHQQFRKFPEQFLTNLAKYPELQLYSLQRDHNVIELPDGIHDLQHFLLSWEDTAAAIMNLDIVITSCTSIAHMAAAMGKETWVVVPLLPYHIWAYKCPESTTSPYYECVRIFRQEEPAKWNGTFQKLYRALEEKFDLEPVEMPNADRQFKRVNLGCGSVKFNNFTNVDKLEKHSPDQVVDLNTLPWPWKDNEFGHIFANNILEYLGSSRTDLVSIIKEMYRISENGAIWEIRVPHHGSDVVVDDPQITQTVTLGNLQYFNQRVMIDRLKNGLPGSTLAFDENIDVEVCDVQYEYFDNWSSRLKAKQISEEELAYALATFRNVASHMKILLQVHKPGRIPQADIDNVLNQK